MGDVILKVKRLPQTAEWRVEWWEDGRYDEDKTYYTSDYQDALDTLHAMENEAITQGYYVEVRA